MVVYSKRVAWLAVLTAIALIPAARAQEKAKKLTAMDEFNMQTATDPQISPDGKKITYVRGFADPMTDRRYSNLWIIGADGADHRALTTGNRNDTSPRWSPDGTRIAYLSGEDGRTQIYVRWMDSGQTARITDLEQSPSAIYWSPDGRMISFAALVPARGPHIADLPGPPEGAKWADPAKAYDRLVYRFNGAGYLKPGFMQLFVVSAEGGAPRQVTSGSFPNGGTEFGPTQAVWTPDGKYLIVSANHHPEDAHEYLDTEVYEFSVSDGTPLLDESRRQWLALFFGEAGPRCLESGVGAGLERRLLSLSGSGRHEDRLHLHRWLVSENCRPRGRRHQRRWRRLVLGLALRGHCVHLRPHRCPRRRCCFERRIAKGAHGN